MLKRHIKPFSLLLNVNRMWRELNRFGNSFFFIEELWKRVWEIYRILHYILLRFYILFYCRVKGETFRYTFHLNSNVLKRKKVYYNLSRKENSLSKMNKFRCKFDNFAVIVFALVITTISGKVVLFLFHLTCDRWTLMFKNLSSNGDFDNTLERCIEPKTKREK